MAAERKHSPPPSSPSFSSLIPSSGVRNPGRPPHAILPLPPPQYSSSPIMGSEVVMRAEPPMSASLSRSRSLGDVYHANNLYNRSQFAATTIPVGMASKPLNIHSPYWTYQSYWPYRYYRNYRNYETSITDSFYWHYPFRLWSSYKQNWYLYDSPHFYRRYHDYYNVYYDSALMGYGNRSKLIENLYQSTPMTQ